MQIKKILSFKIPCLPPSLNTIYRMAYGKVYKVSSVKDFEKEAFEYLPRIQEPIDEFCKLGVVFTFKDNKRYLASDVSNLAKVTEDTLVKAGLLKNDNLITEIVYSKKRGPADRVEGYFYI